MYSSKLSTVERAIESQMESSGCSNHLCVRYISEVVDAMAKSDLKFGFPHVKKPENKAEAIAIELVYRFLNKFQLQDSLKCMKCESNGVVDKIHDDAWLEENLSVDSTENAFHSLFENRKQCTNRKQKTAVRIEIRRVLKGEPRSLEYRERQFQPKQTQVQERNIDQKEEEHEPEPEVIPVEPVPVPLPKKVHRKKKIKIIKKKRIIYKPGPKCQNPIETGIQTEELSSELDPSELNVNREKVDEEEDFGEEEESSEIPGETLATAQSLSKERLHVSQEIYNTPIIIPPEVSKNIDDYEEEEEEISEKEEEDKDLIIEEEEEKAQTIEEEEKKEAKAQVIEEEEEEEEAKAQVIEEEEETASINEEEDAFNDDAQKHITMPPPPEESKRSLSDMTSQTSGFFGMRPAKLILNIIEAKDLPKLDLIVSSDPYCVIKVCDTSSSIAEFKTEAEENTFEPVWNKKCSFEVKDLNSSYLDISIYDEDTLGKDEQLATIMVPLNKFSENDDKWLEMMPTTLMGIITRIHLSVQIISIDLDQ